MVRRTQPVHDLHDIDCDAQILLHQCQPALHRDLRRVEFPVECAAAAAELRTLPFKNSRNELYDLRLSARHRPATGSFAQNRLRPPVAVRHHRHLDRPGTRHSLHRQRIVPSGLCRRPRMVDRVPPIDAFRSTGQLAALLHGSRPGQTQKRPRQTQHSLPYPHRKGTGMGGIHARRPICRDR